VHFEEFAVKTRTAFYWPLLALVAVGTLNSGCSTVAPDGKPAGTATAIGAVSDQVESGNIEVEGDTDPAPLP
jgi:hypothetical protein